jgi:hypothetical protein
MGEAGEIPAIGARLEKAVGFRIVGLFLQGRFNIIRVSVS